jgi:methanogenic corrinoid protein MtbC1
MLARADRVAIAEATSHAFFLAHPDWVDRFGDAGRLRCLEDTLFHLDFLAGSAGVGSPEAFVDYVRWVCSMLEARGIDAGHLVEHLGMVREALIERLGDDAAPYLPSLHAGILALGAAVPTAPAGPAEDARDEVRGRWLEAVVGGRRHEAFEVLAQALAGGRSLRALYAGVVQWAQRELGEQWASNRISVAQEHLATATTQWVVSRLCSHVAYAAPVRGTVVLAGVEGELHQLGLQLLADILEVEGWDVRFLGTNTPVEALARAVLEHRPQVVGLSATLLAHVPRTLEAVARIRQLNGAPIPVVLGGRGFRHGDVPAGLGVAGLAWDLESGVDLVHRLGRS